MIEIKIGTNCIDWNQLIDLYAQTGLVGEYGNKKDVAAIKKAFNNSYKVVSAWDDIRLIGAGRILSDGICYGMIFDIGVLAEYRRQGIASSLVKELLVNMDNIAVHLTSRFGVEGVYKKLGFKKHKNAFAKYPHASPYLED